MTWLGTIGYEGFDHSEWISALAQNEVQAVIDVRDVPLSRKRGFSKSQLAASLESAGIEYVHVRALGNPREYREALKTRYGRSPKEEQQRTLEDIDNVQQKLTDALVALYETLDLRRREAAMRLPPIALGNGAGNGHVNGDGARSNGNSEVDPVSQSIQLLNSFKNSLKEKPQPEGKKKNLLFAPLSDDDMKKRMFR